MRITIPALSSSMRYSSLSSPSTPNSNKAIEWIDVPLHSSTKPKAQPELIEDSHSCIGQFFGSKSLEKDYEGGSLLEPSSSSSAPSEAPVVPEHISAIFDEIDRCSAKPARPDLAAVIFHVKHSFDLCNPLDLRHTFGSTRLSSQEALAALAQGKSIRVCNARLQLDSASEDPNQLRLSVIPNSTYQLSSLDELDTWYAEHGRAHLASNLTPRWV